MTNNYQTVSSAACQLAKSFSLSSCRIESNSYACIAAWTDCALKAPDHTRFQALLKFWDAYPYPGLVNTHQSPNKIRKETKKYVGSEALPTIGKENNNHVVHQEQRARRGVAVEAAALM